jgi:hypothetical protein
LLSNIRTAHSGTFCSPGRASCGSDVGIYAAGIYAAAKPLSGPAKRHIRPERYTQFFPPHLPTRRALLGAGNLFFDIDKTIIFWKI